MQIAQLIANLLYTHDCVILPGIGGFLTQSRSAEVDMYNNTAKPRSKSLAFNSKLNENDGILIHALAKAEACSYTEAKDKLNTFVQELKNELNSNGNTSLKPLGTLYKNEDKLIFIPSLHQNYEIRSYGLPTLKWKTNQIITEQEVQTDTTKDHIIPAIKETSSKKILQQERKEQKQSVETVKKRRSYRDLNIVNVLGSVFLLAMFFTLFNFELGDGSIYQIVDNQAQILLTDSNKDSGVGEEQIKPKDLNTLLSDYQANIHTVYYEILLDGTFSKQEVENIQLNISENYPQSKIIEVENNEYTVSVISFMNEDLAQKYRNLIQKNFQYELIIKSK